MGETPEAEEHGGLKVIIAALAANLGIAVLKLVAALFARSAAMFAEFAHSCADSGNQLFLLLGIRRSQKAADSRHEFGYGTEQYFWGFIVALTMFSVGATYSIYEGIHKLVNGGDAHAGDPRWAYIVLGGSLFLEGLSFRTAWNELKKIKGGRSLKRTIKDARDPAVLIVLFEDTAALVGLTVALAGIALTHYTGETYFDGIASIVVGCVLFCVAVFAARQTHDLLIGQSVTKADRARIIDIVAKTPGVRRFIHMRTMHVGPDDAIAAIKVVFDPQMTAPMVADKVNEIETALRAALPLLQHIFIEAGTEQDPGVARKSALLSAVTLPPTQRRP